MACTCNAICDNDCASNQLCSGHEPACSNSYVFTSIVAGTTVILASHLAELEAAINLERGDTGRRYNSSEPAYCTTHTPGDVACSANAFAQWSFLGSRSAGDGILASHWDSVKNANNDVSNNSGYGGVVSTNFVAQGSDVSSQKQSSVIRAVHIADLQDRINETRNACICDSHCNCDPSDCGCNGECPSHYYYYYP